jgi:plasmid stabilization system protein ParE
MAQITWTDEALRWLENIFEYIAEGNRKAAGETVQGIYDRVQALVDFPEMGQRYQGSKRHVRILLYGHYRIAYLVKPNGDVDILGVFHGALDISQYSL